MCALYTGACCDVFLTRTGLIIVNFFELLCKFYARARYLFYFYTLFILFLFFIKFSFSMKRNIYELHLCLLNYGNNWGVVSLLRNSRIDNRQDKSARGLEQELDGECLQRKGWCTDMWLIRVIKLLEHAMKVLERVIEGRLGKIVKIYRIQCGYMSGSSLTDAIFIVGQLQEKYLVKNKEL